MLSQAGRFAHLCKKFNKISNLETIMLDSIYHMTVRLCVFGVKRQDFASDLQRCNTTKMDIGLRRKLNNLILYHKRPVPKSAITKN